MIEQHCSQCTFPISKCNCGSNLTATDSTKPILAHSLSEYKRLDAMGVNVEPPESQRHRVVEQPNQPAPQLLNCPFCNFNDCDLLTGMNEYWVRCIACGGSSNLTSSKESAIKAWNTRTSTAAVLDKVLEEADKLLKEMWEAEFPATQNQINGAIYFNNKLKHIIDKLKSGGR